MSTNPITIANSAIHTVNTKFPYLSTTRTNRMIKNIGAKNHVSPYLCNSTVWCDIELSSNKNITPAQKHVLEIFKWFAKLIDDFADLRGSKFFLETNPFSYVADILDKVKTLKMANCEEVSVIAAMVLKVRGIKNAYTASLKSDSVPVDHVVALFNKDGSEISDKIVNNKTIVVDTWLGVADYAGNYFSKYRGQCENFVRIPDGKMGIRNIKKYNLDDAQIEALKRKYLMI